MSDLNKYDIAFLQIADFVTKKEIGSFSSNSSKQFSEAIAQAQEILQEQSIPRNKKNKVSFKQTDIFYYLNKDNLLFVAILKNSSSNKIDCGVFEFFEDVEHQGITKYLDKNGELNNVGRQNLIYLIEKYFSSDSGKTSMNSSVNGSKILQVTSEVNDIKLDMKNGIKKLVTNVESVRELENKAERINNTSLLFRKDAELLRKRTRWSNIKSLVILGVIGTVIGGYIVYKILS
jgi:hypothetical protein